MSMFKETDFSLDLHFSVISRTKAPFEVVNQITQAIADGRLAPGKKLPTEAELAELFGVGRNTIREAIKILEAFGLVAISRGVGTYVQGTCNSDFLGPLFYPLLWMDSTEEDRENYFLAMAHACEKFSPFILAPPPKGEKRSRLKSRTRQVSRGAQENPFVANTLNAQMIYRTTIPDDDLFYTLLALSRFLFGRHFCDFRGIDLEKTEWRALHQANRSDLVAPRQMSDYVKGLSVCFLDQRRARGDFLIRPDERKGFTMLYDRERSSYRTVFRWVIEKLVDGTLAPGDRLPTEAELMERFQVGRSVVREAMKGLEAVGVVTVLLPKGTFISQEAPSLPDFLAPLAYGQIMAHQDMSLLLTFKVAARDASLFSACQSATDDETAELLRRADFFSECILTADIDSAVSLAALNAFDDYIIELCHNPILHQVEQVVLLISSDARERFIENVDATGLRAEVAKNYRAQAQAVVDRDPDAVTATLQKTLELWTTLRNNKINL
ncbi:MAG: FadR family transcriptional regulator [Ruminiclostridium sp.]|nr:FadR family transcriptional regulator [Ruminiclostridium sp.]